MVMADQIEMFEMSWTEVDEAMKDRPVALVPVGAIEAHGRTCPSPPIPSSRRTWPAAAPPSCASKACRR